MKKTRFTEAQIVAILKSGDAGMKVKDICAGSMGYPRRPTTTGNGSTAAWRSRICAE